MPGDVAVRAEGLHKSYGSTTALTGLDLEARAGSVLGVLGPNGAGKTTAVRIFTTLLRADAGRATVAGFDVASQGDEVRRRIGLTGQFAAVDEHLTGHENLTMIGQLSGMARADARSRATGLLDRFDLADAANRPSRTYSGGMRRRLDLAASLVARPEVVFLDEPTTGLDPRSRLALWDIVRELVKDGTTLLLTTQYLDEADQLADRIVVIDRGAAIAEGTSQELKEQVGGRRIEVQPSDRDQLAQAVAAMKRAAKQEPHVDEVTGTVSVSPMGDDAVLGKVVRALDRDKVAVRDLNVRRPSLDDVFLTLTGHAAEPSAPEGTDVEVPA